MLEITTEREIEPSDLLVLQAFVLKLLEQRKEDPLVLKGDVPSWAMAHLAWVFSLGRPWVGVYVGSDEAIVVARNLENREVLEGDLVNVCEAEKRKLIYPLPRLYELDKLTSP